MDSAKSHSIGQRNVKRVSAKARSFSLSRSAQRELREILADSAEELTPILEQLVRDHLSDSNVADRHALRRMRNSAGRVKKEQLAAALRVVLQRIDDAMPFMPDWRSLADMLPGHDSGGQYAKWREFRQAVEVRLQSLARIPRAPAGRPKNIDYSCLAHDLAIVLRVAGIKVTKSRMGRFARVLEILLTEAYTTAPEDQFPLIREMANAVNEGTVEELRGRVRDTAHHRGNPEFWRQLVR